MSFFDINTIAFELLGYPISYVELIGSAFGLISVYFATKGNILTWGTGIVNELFLFILFYQVQLYADMLLQVYFFVVTIFGWYNWNKMSTKNSVSLLTPRSRIGISLTIILGTVMTGYILSNIHLYLPTYFEIEANFPYIDSFVMVLSIVATILLAKKKIETWYLWIAVNIVCVVLFFVKGIVFLGIEYAVFLVLASYGLINWKKQLKHA
jgi:nicotinamide mononucleotide transporter